MDMRFDGLCVDLPTETSVGRILQVAANRGVP